MSRLLGFVREWSYNMYGLEPIEKIATFAGPVCMVIGLVLLGAAIAFWLQARSGPARAVARWRVLQVSVGLVGLLGLVNLARVMLLR